LLSSSFPASAQAEGNKLINTLDIQVAFLEVNRRFEGTCQLHNQGRRASQTRNKQEVRKQANLLIGSIFSPKCEENFRGQPGQNMYVCVYIFTIKRRRRRGGRGGGESCT
jgi:hypothetical protein